MSAFAEAPVVKLLVNGVTGFPAISAKPLTVTVYAVLVESKDVGWNVIVRRSLLIDSVQGTETPPAATVTAPLPTVMGLTGLLSCTLTCAFTWMPAAPFAGLIARTWRPVVCAVIPVVKVVAKVLRVSPARFVTPELINSSYCVSATSGVLGFRVAMSPSVETLTLALMATPDEFGNRNMVEGVTVSGFTRSLNRT